MRVALRAILPGLLAAIVSACAATPEPLRGEYAELRPASASEADTGRTVRWGGRLLEVRPGRDQTCFEILEHPLDGAARPRRDQDPGRRFLACRDGFVDPAAFPEGRLLTVVGELSGFRTRAIGDYDYRYPVIDVRTTYLWAERVAARPIDPLYFHGSHFHPHPFHGHPFHGHSFHGHSLRHRHFGHHW